MVIFIKKANLWVNKIKKIKYFIVRVRVRMCDHA